MLESGFTSVLKTRNRDEFQSEVVNFTKRLGFETVSATLVILGSGFLLWFAFVNL